MIDENTQLRLDEPPVTKAGYVKQSYHPQYSKSVVRNAVLPYKWLGAVGIMWPGTFSKASSALRRGGTAMFALLALAGDLGCSGGEHWSGAVASAASDNLKIGILVAIIFPVVMALGKQRCYHR